MRTIKFIDHLFHFLTRKKAAFFYTLIIATFSVASQAEQRDNDKNPTADLYDLSLEELMDIKVDCDGKQSA